MLFKCMQSIGGERPSLRVGVFRVERGSKMELAKILSCICGTNGESY